MTLDLGADEGKQVLARPGRARRRARRELPRGHDGQARPGLRATCARSTRGSSTPRCRATGRPGPYRRRPAYDNSAQATGGLWSMNGEPDRPPHPGRHDHRRPLRHDVRRHRHPRRAAARRADRGGPARRHLAAGLGAEPDRERGRRPTPSTARSRSRWATSTRSCGRTSCSRARTDSCSSAATPTSSGGSAASCSGSRSWPTTLRSTRWPSGSTPTCTRRRSSRSVLAWFADRTKAELEELAGDHVPLSAVKSIDEVVDDPQIAARDMIVERRPPDVRAAPHGRAPRSSSAARPRWPTAPPPRSASTPTRSSGPARSLRDRDRRAARPRACSRWSVRLERDGAIAVITHRPPRQAQRADARDVRRARVAAFDEVRDDDAHRRRGAHRRRRPGVLRRRRPRRVDPGARRGPLRHLASGTARTRSTRGSTSR